MSRRAPFSTITLLILFLVGGCGSAPAPLPSAPSGVVRIVSSLPSRGAGAAQSREISEAIAQAISARGGMAGGWHVEYLALEGGSDETGDWSARIETENASRAASDPSVVAYIGPYNSGALQVSLPVTNRAGLLQASPSATWPGLTMPGWDPGEPDRYYPSGTRNFVRLAAPDSLQAVVAARWAQSLGFSTVAIFDDGSTYSLGMARFFHGAATALGLSVQEELHLSFPLAKLIDVGGGSIGAVFYAPSSASNAVSIAAALGASGPLIFSTDTALDDRFVSGAGLAAEKWRITSNGAQTLQSPVPGRPAASDGTPQFRSQFAANAFRLTNIILDGLDTGTGRDRAASLDYVKSARSSGAGEGAPIFTPSGDPTQWTIAGYVWDGSRFVLDLTFDQQP